MANVERVIIYRLGSLGDTIVALPCFHRIAASFPNARRLVLTNAPVSSKAAPLETILGPSGLIDGSLAYPLGLRSPTALWNLARQLRAMRIDVLVYLTPARGLRAAWRDLIYFRLCGIRRVIGVPLSEDLQLNREIDGKIEPECERLARCLAPLGPIDLHDRAAWDLRLTDAERAEAAALLEPAHGQPLLAINMGGKSLRGDWGAERWRELLERIADSSPMHALLVVGAAEDSARARDVCANWPGPMIDACGKLSPRGSAAALSQARLFIGHDSGPMHLASCVGVPCIGLFGDNNRPSKWHPYGRGHTPFHDMRGVQAIPVDAVADEAVRQLAILLKAGQPA